MIPNPIIPSNPMRGAMNKASEMQRIISNLNIVSEEMRAKGGDPAWHLACEEAAKVLSLVDTRLAMLARSGSSETQAAAFQMRRMISGQTAEATR